MSDFRSYREEQLGVSPLEITHVVFGPYERPNWPDPLTVSRVRGTDGPYHVGISPKGVNLQELLAEYGRVMAFPVPVQSDQDPGHIVLVEGVLRGEDGDSSFSLALDDCSIVLPDADTPVYLDRLLKPLGLLQLMVQFSWPDEDWLSEFREVSLEVFNQAAADSGQSSVEDFRHWASGDGEYSAMSPELKRIAARVCAVVAILATTRTTEDNTPLPPEGMPDTMPAREIVVDSATAWKPHLEAFASLSRRLVFKESDPDA